MLVFVRYLKLFPEEKKKKKKAAMRCAKYKRSFCDQLREKCKGAAQVNFR